MSKVKGFIFGEVDFPYNNNKILNEKDQEETIDKEEDIDTENVISSKDILQTENESEEESPIEEDIKKYINENGNENESEEVLNDKEYKSFEMDDLDNKYVHSILGFDDLIPMVVFMEIGNKHIVEQSIGVPGYYNANSKEFFLLNGEPVRTKNFQEKFVKFIDSISTDV